jgi:hypothetical protein
LAPVFKSVNITKNIILAIFMMKMAIGCKAKSNCCLGMVNVRNDILSETPFVNLISAS